MPNGADCSCAARQGISQISSPLLDIFQQCPCTTSSGLPAVRAILNDRNAGRATKVLFMPQSSPWLLRTICRIQLVNDSTDLLI